MQTGAVSFCRLHLLLSLKTERDFCKVIKISVLYIKNECYIIFVEILWQHLLTTCKEK